MKYSILINTTDSFEDCWIPFFTLFKKYWPDYTGKIYLNTETKSFSFPGLNIISIRNNKQTPDIKITWSECLIRALESIETEVVLYMQEDYFLKDFVKNEIVNKYVQLMNEHTDIHCIHLTDQAVIAENEPSIYENLHPVIKKQRYRISCQAALWRKDILYSYLRPYEDAWQFEEFGSKRAIFLNNNFFAVNKNWIKINQFEIIPYIFTGIVQGRWYEEVVPLFAKEDISVNYSIRGFIKNAKPKPIFNRIKHKFRKILFWWKHQIEVANLTLTK